MADQNSGKRGLQREIARGLAEEVAEVKAAAEGEQLGLFAPPIPDGAVRDQIVAEAEARERKAGRPKGATNLATRQLREFIFSRGKNPVIWKISWLTMTVEQLATYLGCSKLEAFDRQRMLADTLQGLVLPNLAATDEAGNAVPTINMVFGGGASLGVSPDRPPWEYLDAKEVGVTVSAPEPGTGSVSLGYTPTERDEETANPVSNGLENGK
ncbi:hypothetical protein [Pleomorphomonas koreensis]|uniref:hypothetical protein n=1 Tax=Pleomorphomonas koreensis TaxID=257440 RepID=UPI0004795090|nr:hypothetical protein [Pleomorphomonas koreensis]